MTAFAQTLQRQQQEAAAIQTSERSKRRVVRRSPVVIESFQPVDLPAEQHDQEHHEQVPFAMPAMPTAEPAVLPVTVAVAPPPSGSDLAPVQETAASSAISVSPLDLPTEFFSAGLDRRKRNRALLMEWLRTALVEGVDFGRIHIAGKDRCQLVRMGRVHECKDPVHWSKPALFKAGAEKITGMLGMTVHYPTLPAYEDAFLAQADIRTIMLRCELRDAHGHVVAQGAGARQLSQDYGDLNKTLKMVAKSAHIDATLRLAGLSEVFTQDLEDRPAAEGADFDGCAEPLSRPSQRPAAKAPPRQPLATTNELIGVEQLQDLREAIADHGFAEQRVLNWLHQATKGQVSRLEQLPLPMLTTLHKKLGQWADAEAADYSASHPAGRHN
jgi:hypothetical protein